MKGSHKEKKSGVSEGVPFINVARQRIEPRLVKDPGVLDQISLFKEAQLQTAPLVSPDSKGVSQASRCLQKFSARNRVFNFKTATEIASRSSDLDDFVKGANASGKVKEIVVAHDFRKLHKGSEPGMVNGPKHISENITDVRISPDNQSKRDLMFQFQDKTGRVITVPGGQVKTGSAKYVSDKLIEMAGKPGYGKTAYIDARFVNPDGTPRVAADAFTKGQAKRLVEAKVKLRGIPNLDKRGEMLYENIKLSSKDGLDPLGRAELQQLRDDIAIAYQGKNVAGRVAQGAAIAFATAAIVSIVIQYATTGQIDVKSFLNASGKAAGFGAGAALLDAGLYHTAKDIGGMAPEVAKTFSQNGMAAGFCLLAVGADVISEIQMLRSGEISLLNAVSGSAFKAALDVIPLVMAPLGLVGIPLAIGAQLGGRWIISKLREEENKLQQSFAEDMARFKNMEKRIQNLYALDENIDSILVRSGFTQKPTQAVLHIVR